MSTQANFQEKDHSECKLNPEFFLKVSLIFGKPVIDLFASRLSRQVPQYTTWMPDLSLHKKMETVDLLIFTGEILKTSFLCSVFSQGTNAMQ